MNRLKPRIAMFGNAGGGGIFGGKQSRTTIVHTVSKFEKKFAPTLTPPPQKMAGGAAAGGGAGARRAARGTGPVRSGRCGIGADPRPSFRNVTIYINANIRANSRLTVTCVPYLLTVKRKCTTQRTTRTQKSQPSTAVAHGTTI